MRLSVLVETSRAVAATSGRLDKIDRLAELLKRTPPDLIPTVISFLSGSPRQGRIGVCVFGQHPRNFGDFCSARPRETFNSQSVS